jgi:putative ABC transport system permease protein
MNIFRLALLSFVRDWRAGEMRLISIAIIIAVSSLTSVSFFTDRVRQATETQATELLAADLVLQSRRAIPDHILDAASTSNLSRVNVTTMRSMVIAGDTVQIVELKAVEPGYPLRGELKVSEGLFSEEIITREIPAPGTVWVDSRLFQILGINIGSTVSVGEAAFQVTKIITYEPDRGGDMFNMAPRLMMNLSDLAATNLILPASRVQYRLLLGGDQASIRNFRRTVRAGNGLRVEGIRDARPELKSALERAEQFLGLAVLVSIALAGLAIALSSQQYVIRHFDNCAILRCVGAEQKTIMLIYILQLCFLAIACSLIGSGLGYLAQEILSSMLSGMTSAELPGVSWYPVIYGLFAGIVTVTGFSLPQILRLREVSPLRVLRRDLSPLPISALSCYGAAVLSLALLTPWQSGNFKLTALSFLGILLTAILLTLGALLLIRFLNHYRTKIGFSFRFGISNIVRRANLSVAQILGIGLGVMVMLLLTLVRTDLLDAWRDRLPEGTPNYFLINIQEDDVPGLRTYLEKENSTPAKLFPMTRARLVAINSYEVVPENFQTEEARRWARREYNLTWSDQLPAANTISQGKWWDTSVQDGRQFSLEQRFAEELGVRLDDTLTFQIAGREITGTITSLREVEWDSFNVNFFVVASPGMLDGFPASFVTSFHLTSEKKDLIIGLVKAFPSVTVFDVEALITEVRKIMDQVIATVEFVFGFTIIAGIVVLLAALQTTHNERTYESALLSSIGASRRQIRYGLIMEFLLIGLIAGCLAGFSATLVELLLAKYVFNMDIVINFWIWLIAPLLCASIIIIAGLAGTRRVLHTPPVVALREG